MNTVVLTNERPESIALTSLSSRRRLNIAPANLVVLWPSTRCSGILPQNTTSSNPLSRNQRQINVDRVSFDGLPCYESRAKMLPIALVANNIAPVTIWETASGRSVRRSFKANLYGRCIEKRLPEALYVDKQAGWVTAEKLERSGIREDRCRKQVSGRLDYSYTAGLPAASHLFNRWVACGRPPTSRL